MTRKMTSNTDDQPSRSGQFQIEHSEVPAAGSPSLGRGIRVRRVRLLGVTKNYEVDFRERSHGRHRPIGIIAGRTNTGKTSIFKFIDYALGAKTFPRNKEVQRQVRAVVVELQTPDGYFTLERALGANNVLVYPSGMDEVDGLTASTRIVEPISDEDSISQWLLTTVGLQDVKLKEAPSKDDSGADALGFRDLTWLTLFYNERVGSLQLLHVGHTMKELKLRQVVDAVFGVHDNYHADLARRIKEAQTALAFHRKSVEALQEFVAQQQPKSHDALELEAQDLDQELASLTDKLRILTQRETAASDFAQELRQRHATVARKAAESEALVRDRVSVIDRFASLRAQYADDVRKLSLLADAESVFDQLSVTTCPVCFNSLEIVPNQDHGYCSLCHHAVDDEQAPSDSSSRVGTELARQELKAANRRFRELDEYWQRLSAGLPVLRELAKSAAISESSASRELDAATRSAVSPFLGERNELQGRRQANLVLRSAVNSGLKLRTGLQAREANFDRARRNLDVLRKEQQETKTRPDRNSVVAGLSERFSAILHEIEYPKIDEPGTLPPFLDDKLVPFAKGEHFNEASSGGQVLLTLAWMLAIFEVAYETNGAHPGYLMIDTPQKNLGGLADDDEFADIHLIERLYAHIEEWLTGAGSGAQVIVVDNTPPTTADKNVIVRYTRDPNLPPFGLIDNEAGGALKPVDEDVIDQPDTE